MFSKQLPSDTRLSPLLFPFLCLKYQKWFSETSACASALWNVQILKHLGLCVRVWGVFACAPEVLLHLSLSGLTKHGSQFDNTAVWPLLRMLWAFSDPHAECFLVRFHKNHLIAFSLQIAFSYCIKKCTASVYWTLRFSVFIWDWKNTEKYRHKTHEMKFLKNQKKTKKKDEHCLHFSTMLYGVRIECPYWVWPQIPVNQYIFKGMLTIYQAKHQQLRGNFRSRKEFYKPKRFYQQERVLEPKSSTVSKNNSIREQKEF